MYRQYLLLYASGPALQERSGGPRTLGGEFFPHGKNLKQEVPLLNEITNWLTRAPVEQRRTLLAASLGWMLDSMDVMIYALVLGEVQRSMHLSSAASGAMMSATLISAALGGLAFGWFADRFGRVRALSLSILGYSIGTALCGFTQTAGELMTCRIVLGLGMGGEWAS